MKGALALTGTERAVYGDVVGGNLFKSTELSWMRVIVADLFYAFPVLMAHGRPPPWADPLDGLRP